MKKYLSVIICICIFTLTLFGCSDKNATSSAKPKISQITTAEELINALCSKSGKYVLKNNIDLGGAEWSPVEFSGILSGVWNGDFNYTISNFTLKAGKGDTDVGFFSKFSGSLLNVNFSDINITVEKGFEGNLGSVVGYVSADNTVSNIKAENIKITGSVSGGNIGGIVGSAESEITSCYADGKIQLSANANTTIGGLVGTAFQTSESECRTDLDITSLSADLTVGGIAGNCGVLTLVNYGGHIKINGDKASHISAAPLSGISLGILDSYAGAKSFELSGDAEYTTGDFTATENASVTDCYIRDISNLDELNMNEKQYTLRKKVTDYMYNVCSVPWYSKKDIVITVSKKKGEQGIYKANEWYFGMPYSHYTGSYEKFLNYLDENGKLKDTLPPVNVETILGNDCSDSVIWALQQISCSVTAHETYMMICENGFLPVGDYVTSINGVPCTKTTDIIKANDPNVMYESYAKLKMGDILLKRLSNAGHTRLVAEAPFVVRNPDGTIDPVKSYVLFHEQGFKSTGEIPCSSCRIYAKESFSRLLETVYIPETIEEYETCKTVPLSVNIEIGSNYSDILRATASSNYKIKSLRLVAENGKKTVVDKTFYTSSMTTLDSIKFSTYITSNDIKPIYDYETVNLKIYINGEEVMAKELKSKK